MFMQLENILAMMDDEIYHKLLRAIELGKWEDGTRLSVQQQESAIQIVMLWQSRHNHDPEYLTIGTDGQIKHKTKQELKQQFIASEIIDIQSLDKDNR